MAIQKRYHFDTIHLRAARLAARLGESGKDARTFCVEELHPTKGD